MSEPRPNTSGAIFHNVDQDGAEGHSEGRCKEGFSGMSETRSECPRVEREAGDDHGPNDDVEQDIEKHNDDADRVEAMEAVGYCDGNSSVSHLSSETLENRQKGPLPVCKTFAIPPVAMVRVNHAHETCFILCDQERCFGFSSS